MILLYILITVYIIAINVYAFVLVKGQKEREEAGIEESKNGKVLLAALLGGSITVYVSMFLLRYKLGNVLLMVLLPVLAVVNIYVFFLAYRSGLGFIVA